MDPRIRPATADDAWAVEGWLKNDDREELIALYGAVTPGMVLTAFKMSPKVLAWGPEGDPSAIFGVTPDPDGVVGYIWALSTPAILKDWRAVHRSSPAIIDALGEGFQLLANVKDARHRHHIRWLRSLGFTFISTVRLGRQGLPFHEFARIQK